MPTTNTPVTRPRCLSACLPAATPAAQAGAHAQTGDRPEQT
jgi:hypothetical protein